MKYKNRKTANMIHANQGLKQPRRGEILVETAINKMKEAPEGRNFQPSKLKFRPSGAFD